MGSGVGSGVRSSIMSGIEPTAVGGRPADAGASAEGDGAPAEGDGAPESVSVSGLGTGSSAGGAVDALSAATGVASSASGSAAAGGSLDVSSARSTVASESLSSAPAQDAVIENLWHCSSTAEAGSPNSSAKSLTFMCPSHTLRVAPGSVVLEAPPPAHPSITPSGWAAAVIASLQSPGSADLSGSTMAFNLAQVHEAVAAANPDRPAITWGDRTWTYAEVTERTRRFANALLDRGIGIHQERSELAGHQSGQDQVALYLYNGNEYLEAMIGAFKARAAPFNVNYRYVAEELRYLLDNASAKVVVYHAAFAPILADVLAELPQIQLLVQVADSSGHALLPDAVDYEDLLAGSSPDRPDLEWSPDDLYILYTGGTTGMPKGVLWRQNDIFIGAMGGRPFGHREPFGSLEAIVEASHSGGAHMMSAAPLMHGAAQWAVFTAFTGANTVVLPRDTQRLDPVDVWTTVQDNKVLSLQIVGDAMGRPLIDELERSTYDLSGLFVLVSGGAALNSTLKERFLDQVPHAIVLDAVGSSETGAQMGHTSSKGTASTGTFAPGPETSVVNADLTAELTPGSPEVGWLAQRGHVPLGYLGDEAKTAATFPVIDGVRYAVPGDRARWNADGIIELLGRDSVCINSGGEKIFAEEVEQALAHHPAVYDVIVVGRPSEQWGSEVVAVVQLAQDASATDDDLLAEAERHIARYKLPKAFVYRDALVRSPAGKADYQWARAQVS